MTRLRILALEPYYGGSHQAFLDGWRQRSRGHWTVLTLPAHKWKWRMRYAAVTFCRQLSARADAAAAWDVLFCSDMLNLAEFKGISLCAGRLPAVAYFHENQLTYPARHVKPRDFHFAFIHLTTALAAVEVWFNSAFHRDSFLEAMHRLLRRMPDHRHPGVVEEIRAKSRVHPPGIDQFAPRAERKPGPLRILWAARWEHDKDPEAFFEAIRLLHSRGCDFRLSVIGQRFREEPEVFEKARKEFGDHVNHWGYQPTHRDYESVLSSADVVTSTAAHEFFGISVAEAIAAGSYPLVPRRLAYPEMLQPASNPGADEFFYQGGPGELARKLADLADRLSRRGDIWQGDPDRARRIVERFSWPNIVGDLDDALAQASGAGA